MIVRKIICIKDPEGRFGIAFHVKKGSILYTHLLYTSSGRTYNLYVTSSYKPTLVGSITSDSVFSSLFMFATEKEERIG